MNERPNGFYWVRSTDRAYPRVSIAELSDGKWFYPGVSGADPDDGTRIEVLSPRLAFPAPVETGDDVQIVVVVSRKTSDGVVLTYRQIAFETWRRSPGRGLLLENEISAALREVGVR